MAYFFAADVNLRIDRPNAGRECLVRTDGKVEYYAVSYT